VKYGHKGGDLTMAGMGGSDMPDLPAEFSTVPFTKGIVGMARSSDPNSGNSQFFIMFDEVDSLNGQYTVFGKVISGMDVVDKIKRGDGPNGEVTKDPDVMVKVTVQP
jgi:peptidylprolyl isomerase